jgi:hypothetical protein
VSSEALERRESIHKLCVAWMSLPSLPDNAIPASPDDVLWLLAEVARLEQERDEGWRTARLRDTALRRNMIRANAAEAALAVAREREQRMREGLAAVLRQLNRLLPGFVTGEVAKAKALARAALDEPAAAIGRQAVDDYRQDLASLAESQTVASVGQPPSAVTDEVAAILATVPDPRDDALLRIWTAAKMNTAESFRNFVHGSCSPPYSGSRSQMATSAKRTPARWRSTRFTMPDTPRSPQQTNRERRPHEVRGSNQEA